MAGACLEWTPSRLDAAGFPFPPDDAPQASGSGCYDFGGNFVWLKRRRSKPKRSGTNKKDARLTNLDEANWSVLSRE
jgi:hypothetical protein